MSDPKKTATAIKQCLIYLMDDAVMVGMDRCAFHMAMALQEAEQSLGQQSDVVEELAKRLLGAGDCKHTH